MADENFLMSLYEEDGIDNLVNELMNNPSNEGRLRGGSQHGKSTNIDRCTEDGAAYFHHDYFAFNCIYPKNIFQRRYSC